MFGHSSWDTTRVGFRAETRKAPPAQTRVFRATTDGKGVETRPKPGSDVDFIPQNVPLAEGEEEH